MKQIIDVQDEGLVSLLGQNITLLCEAYFYTGKLVGVNDFCVKLENPAIVYETGEWNTPAYTDQQKLPCKHLYVEVNKIESFGILK
jgi:hypothetical protein